MGGGGGDGAGAGVGERGGHVVDQGPAGGGEDNHIAVGAAEVADIDELGQPVQGQVALVLEVGDVEVDGRIADELVVEVADTDDQLVGLGDRIGDSLVRLLAQLLDRRAHQLELERQLGGPAHQFALLQGLVGGNGKGFQGVRQFPQDVADGGVIGGSAEQFLHALERAGLDAQRVQAAHLEAQALEQPLVDLAGEGGELDAGAGAVDDPALGADDFSGIPRRIDVGDVGGDRVQGRLVDQQAALGGAQRKGKGTGHGGLVSSGITGTGPRIWRDCGGRRRCRARPRCRSRNRCRGRAGWT